MAAYNEEKSIPYALDSILEQSYPGDMDILVCANGCKDRTEAIVRIYERNFPNIRLISTEEKGKPNAWNILRQEAFHNYLVFVDADVVFHKDAFFHLSQNLEETGNIAAAAICVPVFEGLDLLMRLVEPPPLPPECLVGRLYAVNNEKLDEKMQAETYPEMPKDIIHEDSWLSLVIGPGNWAVEENAEAYYRPCSWKEITKMQVRSARAEEQIRKDYPALWERVPHKRGIIEQNKMRLKKLKYCRGLHGKALFSLGFPLRKYLFHKSRKIIANEKFENPLDGWETSDESKKPIHIHTP